MRRKVIFRVDGNKSIGFGHVIRCIALAEIIKDTFDIFFYSCVDDPFIISQLKNLGKLTLLPEQQHYFPDDDRSREEINFDLTGFIEPDSIVVLDGYRFGSNYRQAVKNHKCTLICIEDIPSGFYPAEVIISTNPLFKRSDFNCLSDTTCYFGTEYSLLRAPFREISKVKLSESRIFISMGGVDQYDITTKLIGLLLRESKERLAVVYTSGYNNSTIKILLDFQSAYSERLLLYSDIDANRMLSVMDNCDRAILPCSGIMIEAISRGLTIFAGYYSNNQRKLYEWFVDNTLVYPIGDLCEQWSEVLNHLREDAERPHTIMTFKSEVEWIHIIQEAIKKDETEKGTV